MINIATINYHLNGDNVTNTYIDGEETLLDADLVIIDPSEFPSIWEDYPITSNNIIYPPNSDKVRKVFNSKRSEIERLLTNGKIIVTFLYPVKAIKAEFRNQRNYDIITNYNILPISQDIFIGKLTPGKSSGANSIKLSNSKSLFAPYFNAFKNELEYSAYLNIESKNDPDFFLLNRSDMPVGFIIPSGNGIMVFLPPPPNKEDNNKLLGILIGCANKFFLKHVVTHPPNWIEEFKIKGEEDFDLQIIDLNKQLDEISNKIRLKEVEKIELTKYKALLYEQGPELENIVIDSFKLFGFNAENRKLDDLEHDIVFESNEGKGIAEIEGKDNDAINIHKFDQLNRAVDEEFHLSGKYPQGILIGNHYRLFKPAERKEPFTAKVHTVAKKKNFGLLTTLEIYNAVQKIIENPNDGKFKESCRFKILNTTGDIINF